MAYDPATTIAIRANVYQLYVCLRHVRELIETIKTIRDKIEKDRERLSSNEYMTRHELIDPLLKALGWDVSDQGMATMEDNAQRSMATYVLEELIVIEIKKFGEHLEKHEEKFINRAKNKSFRYGVLTNGSRWKVYDTERTNKTPVVEFDATDDVGAIMLKVAELHKLAMRRKLDAPPPSDEQEKKTAMSGKSKYAKSLILPMAIFTILFCIFHISLPAESQTREGADMLLINIKRTRCIWVRLPSLVWQHLDLFWV